MTRPSPRPRKDKAAELGVTSQKSGSERLTGQPDKPEPKHQITHCGVTFLRAETPEGFAAAVAAKSGVGLVSQPESDEQQSANGAE